MQVKPYSLQVSREKIEEVKKGKIVFISHKLSPRWFAVHDKNIETLRLIYNQLSEEVICKVLSTTVYTMLGVRTIRIIVKKSEV